MEFLPPYAPELNPVEYLWAHWKQHEIFCPKDFVELSAFARAKLKRTQCRKLLVAAFWKQADCYYVYQRSIGDRSFDRRRLLSIVYSSEVVTRKKRAAALLPLKATRLGPVAL